MYNNLKKILIIIAIIVVIGLVTVINILYQNNNKEDTTISLSDDIQTTVSSESNKFYVDIKGAVKKPGVYLVSDGMIVNDVIKMAGGIKNNGYLKNINLSKKVTSEMVIYIYSKSEVKTTNSTTSVILNDVIYTTTVPTTTSTIITANNGLININTASKEELMTLNKIGSSKADQIILYRETNPFKSIEDIKNVSGIGDALYESIKDYITV